MLSFQPITLPFPVTRLDRAPFPPRPRMDLISPQFHPKTTRPAATRATWRKKTSPAVNNVRSAAPRLSSGSVCSVCLVWLWPAGSYPLIF